VEVSVKDPDCTIRLLQFTDCHVGPSNNEILLGLNTNESLHDVIDHVKKSEDAFDLLLVTGDISNNGGSRTYDRFLSLIQSSGIPHSAFAWLPGNHDSPEDMNQALNHESLVKEVVIGNWLLVLLNTQVPGHTHGNLNESELNILDNALANHRDLNAMIFMHHQPVPVGCAWVDSQKVRSDYAFFKILEQYSNVRAVVWGHVHQDFSTSKGDIQLMSTPSTCIQFKPNSDEFAIDSNMPGYRRFELKADGSFNTEVVRIPEKNYPIEFTSDGY